MPKKRDYDREYELYDGTPEVQKRRAMRNAARYKLEKAGKVHKFDGKDVDHVIPLSKGGTNKTGLRVQTAHENRSFNRDSKHGVVLRKSKKDKKK